MEGLKSVKSHLRSLKTNNVKMIEGDDKIRAQKCTEELQNVSNKFKCNLAPEVIISGDKVSNRLKIQGSDPISIQAFKTEIAKIFNMYDCFAVPELKFADGQITDRVIVRPIPRKQIGGEVRRKNG